MQDEVGVIGRADRGEIELLRRNVTLLPAAFDVGSGWGPVFSDHGTVHDLLERGRHEDAQLPPINEFRAQEEDTVEDQDGVGGGGPDRRGEHRVRCAVVDRVLETSIAVRAERVEQNPGQGVDVVRVEVAALGRVLAAPVAL